LSFWLILPLRLPLRLSLASLSLVERSLALPVDLSSNLIADGLDLDVEELGGSSPARGAGDVFMIYGGGGCGTVIN
jgi:hypothetical protein